jgi:hypothetical protein
MTKTIEEMADIIEFQTWAGRKLATSSGVKDQLDAALDEEEKADAEDFAQNILDEFQYRQKILGDAYPFRTDGYKLELSHAQATRTTYLFCLGLSVLPSSEIGEQQRSRQFETVVMNAAKNFFGGQAIRIGAPWKSDEVPAYGVLLDNVVGLIPELGHKMREEAPDGGDAGWDVLVVKGFCDGVFPRFVALGNCATGRSNWEAKGMETQPTLFWSYFQGQHRSVFITFFAVPFKMDENDRLRKSNESNLTFDRFRICENAPSTGLQSVSDWLEGQRGNALQIPIN